MSPFMHTSVAARYADAWVAALIPMLFTTGAGMNGTIDTIFPAGRTAEQQAAIMRGFKCVHLYGPMMVGGRAFTAEEMHAHRMSAHMSPELAT